MDRVILAVTGVPASGKSTLSKQLAAELGYSLVDLTQYIRENGLSEGYDSERCADVVDTERLRDHLMDGLRGDTVLDGLLSHRLKPTHALVLRCNPLVLKRRMESRGYGIDKVRENLEAEYMGTILYESLDFCKNICEIDNTEGGRPQGIREWLNQGGSHIIELDWSEQFRQAIA